MFESSQVALDRTRTTPSHTQCLPRSQSPAVSYIPTVLCTATDSNSRGRHRLLYVRCVLSCLHLQWILYPPLGTGHPQRRGRSRVSTAFHHLSALCSPLGPALRTMTAYYDARRNATGTGRCSGWEEKQKGNQSMASAFMTPPPHGYQRLYPDVESSADCGGPQHGLASPRFHMDCALHLALLSHSNCLGT